ncbi:MAG: ubiquitin-like domain-containing protein, partial [Anaerolineales bacterium]
MFEKRLYQTILLFLVSTMLVMSACVTTPTPDALIEVRILVDDQELILRLPPGSTVQEALDDAGITLDSLDRVDPDTYTVLADGTLITVIRVQEEFEVEQVLIPFEQQNQPSEFLPEGE